MRIVTLFLCAIVAGGCGGNGSPTAPPSTPPTPKPARDQFVRAVGDHLELEDGTRFFVQGAVYYTSMYPRYPVKTYPETGTIELVTPFWIYQDFNEIAIEQELMLLRDTMSLNTIKLMIPAYRIWRLWMPEGTPDWFQQDGSISLLYLDRLQRIVAIARRLDLRVTILFDLNLLMDWECPNPAGGWDFLVYPESPKQECRLAPSGSAMDQLHRNYTRSIAEAFKNNPTILMYEVSGEVLLRWPLNGQGNDGNRWYAARMASFVRRRVAEIRAIDGRHLITTGEATVFLPEHPEWWAYPSPEFGLVDDIDGLNGGRPYTLESLMDVVTPHVYNFNIPSGRYEDAVAAMRARTTKPLFFGEFGYARTTEGPRAPSTDPASDPAGDWPDPFSLPVSQPARVAVLKRLAALQGSLTEGGLFWDPYAAIQTPAAGSFSVITIPDGRRFMVLHSNPERRIWGVDFVFTMFAHDATASLKVSPLPEIVNLFPSL
ncbi:MAG: cellulase family glycosylhydrolase [Candidatus Yanofskybacteria bacterium]|nr:cellulase family glycosylhydrolase [Candidatus Yanofskybacteria bacterium]